MDCEEPIQCKKPSYEDNQAKWQEGRGQMARYLSDAHDSVNGYGYQRNVYGAVAVGKLVEFWKYDYLLQNLTKRHVLSGSPISSLQYGPKCPELDSPTTLSMEQEKAMGFFVMNGQCGVFHRVKREHQMLYTNRGLFSPISWIYSSDIPATLSFSFP